MPEWVFDAINPLVPGFVREYLLVWLFDGAWPRWKWLGNYAHWAVAFGIGRYPRQVKGGRS